MRPGIGCSATAETVSGVPFAFAGRGLDLIGNSRGDVGYAERSQHFDGLIWFDLEELMLWVDAVVSECVVARLFGVLAEIRLACFGADVGAVTHLLITPIR